jgi:hypothetical protein
MASRKFSFNFACVLALTITVFGSSVFVSAEEHSGKASVKNAQPTADPRLPPLLPGQEVNINGKKMKVWSTSGNLSGTTENPPPETLKDSTHGPVKGEDLSVIVDGRGLLPSRRDR